MKRVELERLEREATPGPWKANTHLGDKDGFVAIEAVEEGEQWATVAALDSFHESPDRDGPLIAAARNHLPALLRLWKAADRLMDEYPSDLDEWEEIGGVRAALRELEEVE